MRALLILFKMKRTTITSNHMTIINTIKTTIIVFHRLKRSNP